MTVRRRVRFIRATAPHRAGWPGPLGAPAAALEGGEHTMRVHAVVPEGFDDPARPSGGNHYDRRVCAALADAGWDVLIATVPGAWPEPGTDARAALARMLAAIPDGESVLIDGLIASPAAAQLLPHTGRIRITVLLHMPLDGAPGAHRDADALRSERLVLH